jgi:hypothetical protein
MSNERVEPYTRADEAKHRLLDAREAHRKSSVAEPYPNSPSAWNAWADNLTRAKTEMDDALDHWADTNGAWRRA